MSQRTRDEVLKKLSRRYQSAGQEHKGLLLDQAQELFGYHRKSAIRALHAPQLEVAPAGDHRAAPELRTGGIAALVAPDLASDGLCVWAAVGGDVARLDPCLRAARAHDAS